MNFIEKAIAEIAYDNGAVNRFSPIEEVLLNVKNKLMVLYGAGELDTIDQELGRLSDEQFETIMIGEHSEIEAIGISPLADQLLNDIFENI